jgi:phosphate starvation-inducible PhoH-like protein
MNTMRLPEELILLSDEVSRHVFGLSPNGSGLDLLRGISGLEVHARGNRLAIAGVTESVKTAKKFLKVLARRLESGGDLEARELEYLFREVARAPEAPHDEPFTDILPTHSGRQVRAKTFMQQAYIDSIKSREITIAIGPAGTGKTYLAIAMAVKALRDKQVNRLILSRPTIEAGEKLGFLPGDLLEKVDPHFRPLYDALQDFLGVSRFHQLLKQGTIEITPLAYMRGRTFNEAFIILDEAQNTTVKQMRMFLTRMGYGGKMVITGDRTQADLPNPRDSALVTLPEVLSEIPRIGFVHLGEKDVVRHDLVREIIRAYEAFFGENGAKS